VRDAGEEALEAEVRKNTNGLADLKLRHHLTSAEIVDVTNRKEELKLRLAGKANASYQDQECLRLQYDVYPEAHPTTGEGEGEASAIGEASDAAVGGGGVRVSGLSSMQPRPPPTAAGRGSRAMQSSSKLGSTMG